VRGPTGLRRQAAGRVRAGANAMTAHFLSQLEALRRRSLRMASQVEDMVHEACEATFEPDERLAQRVIERDAEVDAAEVEVEAEVIRLLALYQPASVDLRLLCTILKVNNDLERVADCAVNIAERARHRQLQAAARQSAELKQLCPAVRRSLRTAVQAYSADDADAARGVIEEDEAIDALYGQIMRQVANVLTASPDAVGGYVDLLSVAKNLERIADHATNIAEDVVYLATGKIIRHQAES
jgi:phosphate transport system protein